MAVNVTLMQLECEYNLIGTSIGTSELHFLHNGIAVIAFDDLDSSVIVVKLGNDDSVVMEIAFGNELTPESGIFLGVMLGLRCGHEF